MHFQLTYPLALLLLAPLLFHAAWMARRLQLLSRPRRSVALGLRTLLLALLVLALAGLRLARDSGDLTVFYVLDQSQSVPQPQREFAQGFIEKSLAEMGPHDRAGTIMFGADAAVHQPPSATPDPELARTIVDATGTNLADALQLAMACFTEDSMKRIVLLSDGNQNAGEAEQIARSAAASGIAIDVVPLKYENRNDVVLEKVLIDSRVSLDEPFDVKIIATARQSTTGRISLQQDGRLIGHFDVDLEPDRKNVFVIPTQVAESGFHNFQVQMDVDSDLIPENNRGFAFTYAQGEPRVLLVDGDATPSPALAAMLLGEKIQVDMTGPAGVPHTLAEIQNYDTLIFNNVAAADVSQDQMKMIEHAVQNLGVGFIMIGGENSFGAGGYNDSPIERILPVDMELKNDKILPQGALVPIIHTVEIPQGQYWSEQVTMAALDVLSPRDLMGVLYYSWQGGEKWLFALQEVGGKTRLRNLIRTMQPGDMPSFDATLQMAYDALSDCSASVRHIVVISDGDPQTPNPALARDIQAAGITISTVCINPHSPRDVRMMQQLANLGGGNFYNVQAYNQLPQIFIREAATVRKSLIFEEPFHPLENQFSPVLASLDEGWPRLLGYVATSPKDLADVPLVTGNENKDPLLAHWRHGLGKTVAFTSDAKQRWAADWIQWDAYSKFWSQVVRWTLRSPVDPNFQVSMDVDGARGKVIVDAVDDSGDFLNFLNLAGNIVSPSFEEIPTHFRQTGPGRYEADFKIDETGAYMFGAQAATAGAGGSGESDADPASLITGGVTVSYSPEFRNPGSNEPLLYRLADISGGRVLAASSPVFAHDLPSRQAPVALWPLLLAVAMGLFLADVFVRRVIIGWNDVAQAGAFAWSRTAGRLRKRREITAETAASDLLRTRDEVRRRHAEIDARREQLLASLDKARAEGGKNEAPILTQSTAGEKKSRSARPSNTDTAPPPDEKGDPAFSDQLLEARRKARKKSNQGDPSP